MVHLVDVVVVVVIVVVGVGVGVGSSQRRAPDGVLFVARDLDAVLVTFHVNTRFQCSKIGSDSP